MSNQSKGRKISKFTAQASLPADAYLTYISNNTNYKISLADFQASLGVTGSLEQDGAVTGVPVLQTVGSVNKIRNLEPGSGIAASISAENGITIKHDWIEDTTGIKLVQDLTAAQPKLRSLVAGSGINISATNGQIQVALSAVPVSTKTVIVNNISDFPAAVSGVITLADDTEYAIRNDITTANRFAMGNNTVLSGSDNLVVSLNYTGVLAMFTSLNKSYTIKNLKVSAASGTMFDFTGSSNEILQIAASVLVANDLGNISDILGMHLCTTQIYAATNGFAFGGANGVVLCTSNLSTIDAGILYDLGTATFDAFSVADAFVTLNGTAKFLKGAASSANINVDGLGSIVNARFYGTGTPLDTITESDVRWVFFANNIIEDSTYDCLMSLTANATNTVIATVNVPVKIAGTWVEEHKDRFTTDATGRMTYIGEKPVEVDINMGFSLAPLSGARTLSAYVAKNGSVITTSRAYNQISSGVPVRTNVIWRMSLVKNDYIEAFVANNTDAVDILVSDAVMRVS